MLRLRLYKQYTQHLKYFPEDLGGVAFLGKCMLDKHAGLSLATQHLHQDAVHTCNPSDWGWSEEDPWGFLTPGLARSVTSKFTERPWLKIQGGEVAEKSTWCRPLTSTFMCMQLINASGHLCAHVCAHKTHTHMHAPYIDTNIFVNRSWIFKVCWWILEYSSWRSSCLGRMDRTMVVSLTLRKNLMLKGVTLIICG